MKSAAFLFVSFVVVPLAVAQQQARVVQSLSYSDVSLKLRDPEQPTIELLRKSFQIKPWVPKPQDNVTNYLVTKRDSSEIVGVITFRSGVLVKAYRDWTPDDPSAYAFAVALKGALEALKNDGPCVLDTGRVQEPNYVSQTSSIACGNKYVEVTAIESSRLKQGTTASIYEWLADSSTR